MGQRKDFIDTAKAEVGTVEGPKENETKYGAFTKSNFLPWCGSFVNWCANQVGLKIPNCVSTVVGAKAFMKNKQWEDVASAEPLPGYIVFFDFPGDALNRISHVGIVISNNGDGTVDVIEGNTSPDKKGSQRNGGQVSKKLRAFKKNKQGEMISIVGFGRPKFGNAGPSKAAPSKSKSEKCPTCGK